MKWPAFIIAPLALALTAHAQTAADTFFETKIRPVLAAHCYQCHSTSAEKLKANLRLDSRQAMLKGGDLGPAIIPGDPQASLLIAAISHTNPDLKMPPKNRLSDAQVADLTRWVKAGAPWPDDRTRPANDAQPQKRQLDHWAWQPPRPQSPPAVDSHNWVKSPVDQFILANLRDRQLKPAPPAHKRDLIRRATFDLIGLPPTFEQVDAFIADDSPDAFTKVVDRLLASPHYGEKWGRHWLDIARYADSNGLDENTAYANAWRYRDYVIDSFNQDKPYNQFLIEQIAGDLLPAPDTATRHQNLIATAFLALGPKALAEVDEKKMEMDIIDEQLDTLGRSLMGLTLGCARCHDHKFDPISTEDYYALAGIFKSTRVMENHKKLARWYENEIPTAADLSAKSAHEQKLAHQKDLIAKLIDQENRRLTAATRPASATQPAGEAAFSDAVKAQLKQLRDELAALEKSPPEMPSALGVTERETADLPIHIRGNPLTLGKLVPRRFPAILSAVPSRSIGPAQSGRLELAHWLTQPQHPLTARVMVNRIWRWHFGRGIVASTDNFGVLGERPDNQPLLDFLAQQFISSGWSIKSMHRLIMLSSTYQMSTQDNPAAARIDPDNRLLWRMPVRRLAAEEIRDAMLAVSNTLDPQRGGLKLHVKNREYLFDHTSTDLTEYDSRQRSIYLPVIRNNLYDVFQLFDSTDATVLSGDRATTTIPQQALFMLNSPFSLRTSQALAAHLATRTDDPSARIRLLYQLAYTRPPTGQESQRATQLLAALDQQLRQQQPDASKRRLDAWTLLCQTILCANEFVHVN